MSTITMKKRLAGLGAAVAVALTGLIGVQSVVAPEAQAVTCPKKNVHLDVDGVFGPKSVCELQRVLGTTQDGVISGQKSANKKYFPKLTSVTYGSAGSKAIKELQRRLGISQSGQFDKSTITQLQYFLGWTGLYCPSGCVYKGNYDGYFGVNTAKALQAYLNWY